MFPKPQKVGPLPPIPNPYRSRIYGLRRKIKLLLPIVLVVPLIIAASLFPHLREIFKLHSLDMIAEASYLLQKPVYFINDVREAILENKERDKIIADLRDENYKLRTEMMLSRQYFLQNKSLKELLNASQDVKYNYKTARIGSINHHMGTHRTFIESGKISGIATGQGVLNSKGAFGRITDVGEKHAEIQLFNDSSSRVPVYLPKTRQHAILAGDGSRYPTLVYAVKSHEIEPGDLIVTSNAGGVFVEGISVGSVVNTAGGIIRVKLLSNPDLGEFVQIIQNNDLKEKP